MPRAVFRRDVDFGVSPQRARDRRPARRPPHARRRVPRRVPAAARRAPGRQRRDRARGGGGASSARRSPLDVVADAFAHVRSPGRLEVVAPAAARAARRRAQRRRRAGAARARSTRSSASGPRTLVVGLLREKEPHEMLAALGVDELAEADAALVCCRPPSPRALDPTLIAKAAIELGVPRGAASRSSRASRRGRRPRCSRPPRTARSWSPARSTSSARPASVLVH